MNRINRLWPARIGMVAIGILILTGCGGDGSEGNNSPASATITPASQSASAPVLPADSPLAIEGEPAAFVRAGSKYQFQPRFIYNGAGILQFFIVGRPAWAYFDPETGRLFGRPAETDIGSYPDIEIRVSDGINSASLPPLAIRVTPPLNEAPTISGQPLLDLTAGELFSFKPSVIDPDGDALSFNIANKPGWAYFSIETGRIWGTPSGANTGIYPDIRISVADGSNQVTLPPFALTVAAAQLANSPPTIAGSPAREVKVGNAYSFLPTVSYPDESALTFSIRNKPFWADFDQATGRLSGTPTINDIGTKWAIVIAVSDGSAAAELGPFSIRVDPATIATRKYHPGHYIAMTRGDGAEAMNDSLRPGVAGLQRRYYWKVLEPGFNQYDFSQIKADLEVVAAQGKQLVVMVEDKSFNGILPTPPYLHADHTVRNRASGYTAKRWTPYVVQRFTALIEALGKEFDGHPAFEGIAFQETSLSINDSVLDAEGYTPEKYRDAIIDVLNAAAASFPNSQVFWYMNFLAEQQSYLADIAAVMSPEGVAMGGPDILPDSLDLQIHVYPLYQQFNGKMPLFNSAQYDSYEHLHKDASYPTKYWTPRELFVYARDTLNISYLFWSRKTAIDPGDEGSYLWTDALPIIKNNPVFNP